MAQPLANIPIYTNTGHTLTPLEQAFISAFMVCKNVSQAVREAGYKAKRPEIYGRTLLERDYIREEIQYRMKQAEEAMIAKPAEILRFYTSVMRGEVLDQFGIEASIDTRIKAANELAKHQIEIPLKMEQKNISNNVGSITLNFLPRPDSSGENE
jgi:phage terminase small subunit